MFISLFIELVGFAIELLFKVLLIFAFFIHLIIICFLFFDNYEEMEKENRNHIVGMPVKS
jgi:hypothetical protein